MKASPQCVCPFCQGSVSRKDIRAFRFDCPHCFKGLAPCYFRGYLWVRGFSCFGAALVVAWHAGWTGSFVIFVVGFYFLPMVLVWDWAVREFFLPSKIEPAPT